MSFELFIALRYLLARRQQSSISRVSLFSTIGVAVGVMALVVALALMTGLQGELRNRILGSQAHIYVWKTGSLVDYESEVTRLQAVPGVAGAGPAILGKAIVSSDRSDAFITLKGVDPVLEGQVTDIERTMTQGSLEGLTGHGEDERPGILLGHDLAQTLGVSVGDEITLITPGGSLSPMGLMPRNRRVKVVGSDHPEAKRSITLVRVARRLGAFTLLEVTIKTGRTHQIRVHLASQGHPIAGDDKYGDFELNRSLQRQGLRRMFLHAWRLQFRHPATGEPVQLEAPLPTELQQFADRHAQPTASPV